MRLPNTPRSLRDLLHRGRRLAAGRLAHHLGPVVRRAHLEAAHAGVMLREIGVPLPSVARLVYSDDYVSSLQDPGPRHAFDVQRPRRIIHALARAGLISRGQVLHPEAASTADVLRVHDANFFAQLRSPAHLARLLALAPNALEMLEDPLHVFLLQAGGTALALEHAICRRTPTFNLGGGFHHAQRDRAEGFCPINDVAIAIERVRRRGLVDRVLVIDLDYHHGNGTALIYAEDEQVFTLSIHGQSWAQIEGKRNHLDVQLPAGTGDSDYLAAVKQAIPQALRAFQPQAAIYLAGADPFAEDDFGDFLVSEEGMLERDLFVWRCLREAKVPFAVVLAGGYGPLAWTISYNFIYSVLTGTRIAPSERPSNIAAQYQRIKRELGPGELRRGDHELANEPAEALLGTGAASALYMATYTREGLELALERYGFLQLLRDLGFRELIVSTDTRDPLRHVARIHDQIVDPQHLLVEVVTRLRMLNPSSTIPIAAPTNLQMLSIEWLCMQNPRVEFSLERPPLPGQRHPGLGLGRWMLELLRNMAERLHCAGVLSMPDHYHNARIYSQALRFFDPRVEGAFRALRALLDPLPLTDAIRAMEEDWVVNSETGEPWRWEGSPQVLPVAAALRNYLHGEAYLAAVDAAEQQMHLVLRPRSTPSRT